MDLVFILVLLFQILIGIAVFVALIYLIVKRVEEKRNETFEKRDN